MKSRSFSCDAVLCLSRFVPRFGVTAAVGLLLAAAIPGWSQTATSAVPGLFNFQGKVTNANGTPVGAGTPVNRTVIFRIWDHASNSTTANLIYSEQQTVTITEGEFSVLIGQGTAVSGTPLGYSETAKGPTTTTIASAAVFGGANRYLGITLDDGNSATTDPEITPRQQLVTSAYAFRAKYAESVGSNGASVLTVFDSGNVGIGAANPAARLDVAGNVRAGGVANASFVLANADNNPVGTVGTASSAGALSTNAAVNDVVVRADAGKLLLQAGAGAAAIAVDTSNKVGIGTTTPGAKLEVASTDALNTAFISNTGGGSGTQPALRVKMAAASGARNVIQAENSSGSVFVVRDDGNVGVGTTAPAARLDVNGAIILNPGISNNAARPAVGTARVAGEIGAYSGAGTVNDDGFLRLSAGGGTTASAKSFIDLSGFSNVADMDKTLVFGTAGAERLRISNTGALMLKSGLTNANVRPAVGSTRITSEINGYSGGGVSFDDGFLRLSAGGGTNANTKSFIDLTGFATTADMDKNIVFGTAGAERMRIGSNGRVGIGTASPAVPLHVSNWAPVDTYEEARMDGFGAGDTPNAFRSQMALGAIIDSGVRGAYFIVNSDARIKQVQGRSDGTADLATLLQIEITDYTYRDKRANGGKPQKKVIAQQVERVFPQAVNQGTDVVPDIGAKATLDGGWIIADTDLKVGERVRLVGSEGSSVCEVLDVQPGRFRAAFESKSNKVFVYGREVPDFRSVDYEAIAMLNVSATQELARENDALKKRVAELEAKDRARDARMASIEKLLQANQTVMAAPAKPANSNGQE